MILSTIHIVAVVADGRVVVCVVARLPESFLLMGKVGIHRCTEGSRASEEALVFIDIAMMNVLCGYTLALA